MSAKAALVYVLEKYKEERELENRKNYDSMMLYFIAQPTRARPDLLPVYRGLFDDETKEPQKPDTGADIMSDIINAW